MVARHTLNLAEWLAKKGAAVSMENPESSWLWKYLDFDADLEPVDVTISACFFRGTLSEAHASEVLELASPFSA